MNETEDFPIRDFHFRSEKGGILKSKELDDLSEKYSVSKIPDSYFGRNSFSIDGPLFTLKFGAEESLSFLRLSYLQTLFDENILAKNQTDQAAFETLPFVFPNDVKVPTAHLWKKNRVSTDEKPIIEQELDQDWTYLNHFRGLLLPKEGVKYSIAPFKEGIPKQRLSVDNKILFYKDLFLYEDDLGDFGYSRLRLRARVQADCAFVLMRSYIRVDGSQIRAVDNRVFVDFNDSKIYREIDFFNDTFKAIEQNGFVFDAGFNLDMEQDDKVTKSMQRVARYCDVVTFSNK